MSVILMRGKIGSGKSHKARELCENQGMVHLCMDSAMEAVFGKECIGREAHVKAEAGLLAYFLSLAKELDSLGIGVVIDHGFWSLGELRTATDYLEKEGVSYRVILMEADFEVRLRRVEGRQDGKPFTREKLQRFDGYFED